jgi:hypothetical protein
VSAVINLNDPAIRADLERRIYDLKQRFVQVLNANLDMEINACEQRAAEIAVRLAAPGDVGRMTAEAVLEYLVGECEAQTGNFWLTALGRAIAYQCGVSGETGDKVNRRMVLQQVTRISRQGTYKVQEKLAIDGTGNIKAEALRDYLQKREWTDA